MSWFGLPPLRLTNCCCKGSYSQPSLRPGITVRIVSTQQTTGRTFQKKWLVALGRWYKNDSVTFHCMCTGWGQESGPVWAFPLPSHACPLSLGTWLLSSLQSVTLPCPSSLLRAPIFSLDGSIAKTLSAHLCRPGPLWLADEGPSYDFHSYN